MKKTNIYFRSLRLLMIAFLLLQMGCDKEVETEGTAPVTAFTGNPKNGTAPLIVNFTDQSTNSPTIWQWDFGDGGTSMQQNPVHTYNAAGAYTVKLTATNNYGADAEEKAGYIVVSSAGVAPVAAFSANPVSGTEPLTVSFTDQSANSPTSWQWDFGDGGTSLQQNPVHTYNSAGTYTVQFTATNSSGSDTETKNDYITVSTAGGAGQPCPGIETFQYQGQTYNTVLIGDQCWMKENLNWATGNSWCYDENPANCDTYGRLYDWATIMNGESSSNGVPSGVQGICPNGWHMPSDEEWKILQGTVDSQYGVGDPIWDDTGWRGYDAGTNLKSTSGWNSKDNGVDLYGFTALPGGSRDPSGSFGYLGDFGFWWSSTEESSGWGPWYRALGSHDPDVLRDYYSRFFGRSVRCLKD